MLVKSGKVNEFKADAYKKKIVKFHIQQRNMSLVEK
jgi:hypothetical protein